MTSTDVASDCDITSPSALNTCEICNERAAKYTCPRCEIHTCSLECVKTHKADTQCSGKRDKTKYVPIKDMTDMNLLNDYRFLEDCNRKAESSLRDPMSRKRNRRPALNKMITAAKQRRILLDILPHPMTKHVKNTSYLNYKEHLITWHVEWNFPLDDVTFTDRVSEKEPMKNALEKYVHPTKSTPEYRIKLKSYVSQSAEELHAFMKVERQPANSVRYYSIDLDKTTTENLCNKRILEFPTFIIVPRGEVENYPLIEGNVDMSEIQTILNKCQKPKPRYQKSKRGQKPVQNAVQDADQKSDESAQNVDGQMEDERNDTNEEMRGFL